MGVQTINTRLASAERELEMSAVNQFVADVTTAMAPIIIEYGYQVIDSDDSYIRLDSGNASIQVRYDRRRSFEIGVGFSEQRDGRIMRRIPFDLGEVFREFGVPEAEARGFLQTSDPTKIRNLLAITCRLLLDHCRPILRGDMDAFAAVNERRSKEAASYTQHVGIEAVRNRADEAWRSRRYQEFVDLLGGFRAGLSDADQKRLDYAARKAAGG